MAQIIDGKGLAEKMQQALTVEVTEMKAAGVTPGLVVVLVGANPASQTYVKNKRLAAERMGIHSKVICLPETVSQAELLSLIEQLNADQTYHGILVQLPLPKHIDEEQILLAIDPQKDVDGFHPYNLGKLFIGEPLMIPCTPYGIMKMLEAYDISVAGKHAVVVGRSNIVGKPMAQLLLANDATVTMTHSRTKDLAAFTRQADILVVAVGRGEMINAEHVKPGAVVIDVGMNRNAEGKLVGDVDFASVEQVARYITPVPKGVGPMTITMLMAQTVAAAKSVGD